jgi:hypothetical protein
MAKKITKIQSAMALKITAAHLSDNEYKRVSTKKNTIYLHHTAGGARPDWTINAWEHDSQGPIATAYVVGGNVSAGKVNYDGAVYEAFDPQYWAHHLGLRTANNVALNQQSIGIEICNYGYAILGKDNKFYNYVNTQLPSSEVFNLGYTWQGKNYYQKYTAAQLASVKELVQTLGSKYGIDYRAGLPALLRDVGTFPSKGSILSQQKWLNKYGVTDQEGQALSEDGQTGPRTQAAINKVLDAQKGRWGTLFTLNSLALAGKPGLWTHVNVRADKFDCWPQPELVALLKSL